MTENDRESNDDIMRAFKVLERADASETEVDTALTVLARALPTQSPRPDFSVRVMTAIRQAQLSAGRQKRRARRPGIVIAGVVAGAAVAAGLSAAILQPSVLEFIVVRLVALAVQACLFVNRSFTLTLTVWTWGDSIARTLTTIITSTQMLAVLMGVTLLSLVSLAGLTHLVSPERGSTKW